MVAVTSLRKINFLYQVIRELINSPNNLGVLIRDSCSTSGSNESLITMFNWAELQPSRSGLML